MNLLSQNRPGPVPDQNPDTLGNVGIDNCANYTRPNKRRHLIARTNSFNRSEATICQPDRRADGNTEILALVFACVPVVLKRSKPEDCPFRAGPLPVYLAIFPPKRAVNLLAAIDQAVSLRHFPAHEHAAGVSAVLGRMDRKFT